MTDAARDGHTLQDLETDARLADYRHWANKEAILTYERMIRDTLAGIGRATRTIAVVGGSETFDLPAEFRALRGWIRSDMGTSFPRITPVHIDPLAAMQNGWLDASQALPPAWQSGAYYLEGGGVDESNVAIPRRIRLLPAAKGDVTITMVYVTQAPTFGDPASPADDATVIDFQVVDAYEMTVAGIRARAATRGDQKEEQKAITRWATSLDRVLRTMAPDQHRSIDVGTMGAFRTGATY